MRRLAQLSLAFLLHLRDGKSRQAVGKDRPGAQPKTKTRINSRKGLTLKHQAQTHTPPSAGQGPPFLSLRRATTHPWWTGSHAKLLLMHHSHDGRMVLEPRLPTCFPRLLEPPDRRFSGRCCPACRCLQSRSRLLPGLAPHTHHWVC